MSTHVSVLTTDSTHPVPVDESLPCPDETLPHDVLLLGFGEAVLVERIRDILVTFIQQRSQTWPGELVEDLLKAPLDTVSAFS